MSVKIFYCEWYLPFVPKGVRIVYGVVAHPKAFYSTIVLRDSTRIAHKANGSGAGTATGCSASVIDTSLFLTKQGQWKCKGKRLPNAELHPYHIFNKKVWIYPLKVDFPS